MNNAQKIELIVSKLNRKIIDLEYCDNTRVTMRIDKIIPFLKELYGIAVDDMTHRKFDLSQTISNGSIAYEVGGESISVGANVLTYGDQLKITVSANATYYIKSIKVNNVDFVNGSTLTVADDIAVVVVIESIYQPLVSGSNYSIINFATGITPVLTGFATDTTLCKFTKGETEYTLKVKVISGGYQIECASITVYDSTNGGWKNLTEGQLALDDSYACSDISEATGWNGTWVGALAD